MVTMSEATLDWVLAVTDPISSLGELPSYSCPARHAKGLPRPFAPVSPCTGLQSAARIMSQVCPDFENLLKEGEGLILRDTYHSSHVSTQIIRTFQEGKVFLQAQMVYK